jgi:porin
MTSFTVALTSSPQSAKSLPLARAILLWLLVGGLHPACAGEGLDQLFSQDHSDWATRQTLLGDVGGVRPSLAEHGVELDLSTTQFYQGIVHGGLEEAFQYGGRNDYFLKIDGAKAGLGEGLLINLHGETRYGEATNSIAGAISVPNTALLFPVPGETITALTNVTFTQFLSPNLAVTAGKINTLDNYRHPFAAGVGRSQFQNLSLNFPLIFARTVPYSALGAGVIVLREMQPVFSLLVVDPAGQPTTSGFEDFFEHGVTLFGQLSIPVNLAGRPGHQQLYGSWSNRSVSALDQTDYLGPFGLPGLLLGLPGNPLNRVNRSWALHYSGDQYLWVDPGNPQRGWGVFGQASISDGNPNPIRWFLNAGIGGSSPLATRPKDTMGVGVYWFQLSTDLKQTLNPLIPLRNESGVELYYNAAFTPWCHVTPSLQVIEPALPAANTAVLLGVRTNIDF